MHLQQQVSQRLGEIAAGRKPAALYDAVRYILEGGGKRVRPVLLLLCAEMVGVGRDQAMPAALALEIAHNWTLVHDDIMDDATSRRGRATVHEKWDADTALLCGDVLFAMAYEQLARTGGKNTGAVIQAFTRAALALCEGQTLDMQFEGRRSVTMPEYLDMVDRKTGALMGAAMEIGVALGDSTESEQHTARYAGVATGRAFQIMDDLLDLVAEDGRWGKTIGGDLVEGKRTFLVVEAQLREDGTDGGFFGRIRGGKGLSPSEIDEAREHLERLGVLSFARAQARHYTREALSELRSLPWDSSAVAGVLERMAARVH